VARCRPVGQVVGNVVYERRWRSQTGRSLSVAPECATWPLGPVALCGDFDSRRLPSGTKSHRDLRPKWFAPLAPGAGTRPLPSSTSLQSPSASPRLGVPWLHVGPCPPLSEREKVGENLGKRFARRQVLPARDV